MAVPFNCNNPMTAPTKTKTPQFAHVSRLLAPRSIAVIGASEEPGNLGGVAIRMLQKFNTPAPSGRFRARDGRTPATPDAILAH
jgi:acyl-CoA synthetase (NDP forming)